MFPLAAAKSDSLKKTVIPISYVAYSLASATLSVVRHLYHTSQTSAPALLCSHIESNYTYQSIVVLGSSRATFSFRDLGLSHGKKNYLTRNIH